MADSDEELDYVPFWLHYSIAIAVLTSAYIVIALYFMHRVLWGFDRISIVIVCVFTVSYIGTVSCLTHSYISECNLVIPANSHQIQHREHHIE